MADHINIRIEEIDDRSIGDIVKMIQDAGFTKMTRAEAIRIAIRFLSQYLVAEHDDKIVENITRCLDSVPR